ncbi:MAG: glycosyltransferase family 4 protein [Ruminococcaceae bacterium]|nr:glycosyltransferase family 4 protein [Oscillospiraceae bacterium]
MKKLLMTASVYSHISNFHLPYLREFQRLGWETHVGCRDIPADAPYIDEAIELPFEKRMQSRENFRLAHLLRRKIASEGYDLIITHTSLAAFFTRLAVKGGRTAKMIYVCHGYLFDDDTPLLKRSILLNAERLVAPQTDLLLTMNAWDYEAAKKNRLGLCVNNIPGIGVDFARLDKVTLEDGLRLRKELGVPRDAFVLIYPAEFSKRKSQHVLIEAMTKLPERVVMVLPGYGDFLDDCKKQADKLNLGQRVLFPGQVDGISDWYRMADASVSASRSEGLPFNVMEAMYMGLPVIASAVKGHLDLIDDGETGLLYPYGDAAACAEQILRLADNAALRERICMRARTRVSQYALDAVLPEVMRQYLGNEPEPDYQEYALNG